MHDLVARIPVAVEIDTCRLPGRPGRLRPQEGGVPAEHRGRIGGPEGHGSRAWSARVQHPQHRVVEIAVAGEVGGAIARIGPADSDNGTEDTFTVIREDDEAAIS